MSTRLGKGEWIEAGLRALAAQGIEAVRVERLAQDLCVTKGSFYWHFKDRKAFYQSLLGAWRSQATGDIIKDVEAAGGDARFKLRTLFTIVLAADGRLDREIRAWAMKDKQAHQALAYIDKRRLAYLETLFEAAGFSSIEAAARARLVYHAFIGQFFMGVPGKSGERASDQFEIIFEMLVRNDD